MESLSLAQKEKEIQHVYRKLEKEFNEKSAQFEKLNMEHMELRDAFRHNIHLIEERDKEIILLVGHLEYLKSSKESTIDRLSLQHSEALSNFQKRYLNEINSLESERDHEVDLLKRTHGESIRSLHDEIDSLRQINRNLQVEKTNTIELHKAEVLDLIEAHKAEVTKLSENHKVELANLNEFTESLAKDSRIEHSKLKDENRRLKTQVKSLEGTISDLKNKESSMITSHSEKTQLAAQNMHQLNKHITELEYRLQLSENQNQTALQSFKQSNDKLRVQFEAKEDEILSELHFLKDQCTEFQEKFHAALEFAESIKFEKDIEVNDLKMIIEQKETKLADSEEELARNLDSFTSYQQHAESKMTEALDSNKGLALDLELQQKRFSTLASTHQKLKQEFQEYKDRSLYDNNIESIEKLRHSMKLLEDENQELANIIKQMRQEMESVQLKSNHKQNEETKSLSEIIAEKDDYIRKLLQSTEPNLHNAVDHREFWDLKEKLRNIYRELQVSIVEKNKYLDECNELRSELRFRTPESKESSSQTSTYKIKDMTPQKKITDKSQPKPVILKKKKYNLQDLFTPVSDFEDERQRIATLRSKGIRNWNQKD